EACQVAASGGRPTQSSLRSQPSAPADNICRWFRTGALYQLRCSRSASWSLDIVEWLTPSLGVEPQPMLIVLRVSHRHFTFPLPIARMGGIPSSACLASAGRILTIVE